jgi:hypothetical protein
MAYKDLNPIPCGGRNLIVAPHGVYVPNAMSRDGRTPTMAFPRLSAGMSNRRVVHRLVQTPYGTTVGR